MGNWTGDSRGKRMRETVLVRPFQGNGPHHDWLKCPRCDTWHRISGQVRKLFCACQMILLVDR